MDFADASKAFARKFRKWGLLWRKLGPHLTCRGQGGPTCMPSFASIHPIVWPSIRQHHRQDRWDREDRQTVVQK